MGRTQQKMIRSGRTAVPEPSADICRIQLCQGVTVFKFTHWISISFKITRSVSASPNLYENLTAFKKTAVTGS